MNTQASPSPYTDPQNYLYTYARAVNSARTIRELYETLNALEAACVRVNRELDCDFGAGDFVDLAALPTWDDDTFPHAVFSADAAHFLVYSGDGAWTLTGRWDR